MQHLLAGFFNATKPVSYAYRNTANPPNAYLTQANSSHFVNDAAEVYATYGYNNQMVIVKHAAMGDIESLKLLTLTNVTTQLLRGGVSVARDSAGCYYYLALGLINVGGSYYQRPVLFKYDNTGNLLWSYQYYMINANEYPVSLYIDSNDNIYLTGWGLGNTVFPENTSSIFLLKLNTSGDISFSKRYKRATAFRSDAPSVIQVDTVGNIYIAGSTVSGPQKPTLIKLNSNGDILWTRIIRDPNYPIEDYSSSGHITNIKVTNSGDIYCVGRHNSTVSTPIVNPDNVAVWKFNSSGNLIWQRCLKYDYRSYPGGVDIDSTGDIIINGTADNSSDPNNPVYGLFAKFDSSGTLQWQRLFYLKDGTESSVQYLGQTSLVVKNDQMYGLFSYSYRDLAIGTYYGIILASLRADGVELVNSDVNYAAGSPTLVTPLFIAESISYTTPTSTWTRSAVTVSETTITDFSGNLLTHFFY